MDEIEFIEKMKVLELLPGDALVLKAKDMIPAPTQVKIRESFEKIFPGHKLVILGPDIDLEIIRQGQ